MMENPAIANALLILSGDHVREDAERRRLADLQVQALPTMTVADVLDTAAQLLELPQTTPGSELWAVEAATWCGFYPTLPIREGGRKTGRVLGWTPGMTSRAESRGMQLSERALRALKSRRRSGACSVRELADELRAKEAHAERGGEVGDWLRSKLEFYEGGKVPTAEVMGAVKSAGLTVDRLDQRWLPAVVRRVFSVSPKLASVGGRKVRVYPGLRWKE